MQALELREKLFGPEHPAVAESLNNLGLFYQGRRRNAEAEPLLVRALKLKKKVLIPEHPHVAAGMNSLAVLFQAQGRVRGGRAVVRAGFGTEAEGVRTRTPRHC